MSFWTKPGKAIKGAISNYVPGGKYLTGASRDHQKFHYNRALDNYNNYANTAQSQINSLSQNLQQSMQNLRSLEEQKQQHSYTGQHLQSHISKYEEALTTLERHKSAAAHESESLQKAVSSFRDKAPLLAGKISEVEKLPSIFENLYKVVAQQKERMAGLSEEEAGNLLIRHRADVEALKKQRQDTDAKIRAAMAEITGQHNNLGIEKANLEGSLERYQYRQDKLLQESNSFEHQRNSLQKIIQDYKNEQDKINNAYLHEESKVKAGETSLQSYITGAQSNLDSLGKAVEWRAGKYKREAKTTGLVQGAALALGGIALSAGLGGLAAASTPMSASIFGSLATGFKYAAPTLGIATYLNNANGGQNLRGFERMNLGATGNLGAADLSHIARYGLGNSKVAIPELGGLKQSLSHFDMPTLPKLKDLPQLNEALGKIVSIKDIEGLSLGLPSMTSASGRKYSSEVLYNSDFIKKLKKVSRRLAVPYLKQNPAMTATMGASNIYG